MRTFYNSSGQNVTAATMAWLDNPANRNFSSSDLYVINTAPNLKGQYLGRTFLLTDFPQLLKWGGDPNTATWNATGNTSLFTPAPISRNEVSSEISTEAATLEVTWSPDPTVTLDPLLTALQGFRYLGVWNNGTVEVWRCPMPAAGDCDSLGACLMFAGRIGEIQFDRLSVKMSVIDRRELLNVQIPLNQIESTNILAQSSVGIVPPNAPALFTVGTGSTQSLIYASGAASGYTPANDLYDGGYLIFQTGKLAGYYAKVYRQYVFSGSMHAFYLQWPLPLAPAIGDGVRPLAYVPPDQPTALAQGQQCYCFPYVPSPLNSAVIL
jgi:hypothetical protein